MKLEIKENIPILVTCGLPYANGACHIGHLRTYIPADIYVRCLRKLGYNVLFVCGSDTHGTPIVINAEEAGTTPEKFAERYHEYWGETFKKLGVEFSHYGNTDSQTNHARTQEIVRTLMERGYIYSKIIQLAYCPECDRFLPDRYVEGVCLFCGMPARGDECDQGCGRHLEPGEVLNPKCKVCNSEALYKPEKHYFFKLSEFKDFLLDYLETLGGTSNARNYAREWVLHELNDWCITRNLNWGVKFPGTDLVVYVWVDAPIGYISFTEEATDEWEDYWRGNSRITHFIGGDIIYHHCVFWPAILKGASYTLPSAVVASGMVKVDNKTFSKSRGYVVWIDEDYLKKGFHPDQLRYYLAGYTSHTKELNFSWKVFGEKVNSELVGSLGNFIYRTLLFAQKNFGQIPDGELEEEVLERIIETKEKIINALEDFEFKKIVDSIMALSDFGNTYFQSHEIWKLIKVDRNACANVLKNSLQIIKALSIFFEPVMPSTMQRVQAQLDLTSTYFDDATVEIAPIKLSKPKMPFTKIQDEQIAEMADLLKERMSLAEGHQTGEQRMETITIDEFKKMDMRIAKVICAERVNKSDKLLKVTVDISGETRQVVAGIATQYDPEELVGKEVVLLANMAPIKLMGIESRGMILAADNDGKPILLEPSREVPVGTKVK